MRNCGKLALIASLSCKNAEEVFKPDTSVVAALCRCVDLQDLSRPCFLLVTLVVLRPACRVDL